MSGVLNLLTGCVESYQSLSTQLTAGSSVVGGNGFIGYNQAPIGSLTVSTFNGYTITSLEDHIVSSVAVGSQLSISGFSAQPAASWLGSVIFHGVTLLGTSATLGFSGGIATWTWSTPFGFSNAGVYPGTIQHQ